MEPDMGAFIRETMRGDDRIRDKGSPQFSPPPVVTRTVENIKEGAPTLPIPLGTAGAVIAGAGENLNLTIRRVSVQQGIGNESGLRLSGSAPIETDPPVFYWRNGLFLGTDEPDEDGLPVGLIEKEVTYLEVAYEGGAP